MLNNEKQSLSKLSNLAYLYTPYLLLFGKSFLLRFWFYVKIPNYKIKKKKKQMIVFHALFFIADMTLIWKIEKKSSQVIHCRTYQKQNCGSKNSSFQCQ
jgi:hypothetical protein